MGLSDASWRRRIAVGLLGTVLLLAVLGTNVVIGAERTALDADFVADGLDEGPLYQETAEDLAAGFEPQGAVSGLETVIAGEGPNATAMAHRVVSSEWLRTEVERNLQSAYAYLHSQRDDLSLVIQTSTVKTGFAEEFEDWVLEADAATLDPRMGDLTESESVFRETRQAFTDRQLQRIQAETEDDLSRDELEARYDDQRDDVQRALMRQLEDRISGSEAPPSLADAYVDYAAIGIEGLVAPSLDYEEFTDAEATARNDLATAVGDAIESVLDEQLDDQQDLTEEFDDDALATLDTARGVVSVLDLLVYVLPAVAIGLALVIGYASRRRSNAFWRVGSVVAIAGVVVAILAWILADRLPEMIGLTGPDAPAQAGAIAGLISGAFGAILTQSLLVLALGLVLIAFGIAVRRGAAPLADAPADADTG